MPDTDPVQVHEAWIATCDSCGWHTQPASPKGVVREWARLHRVTCPLQPAPALNSGERLVAPEVQQIIDDLVGENARLRREVLALGEQLAAHDLGDSGVGQSGGLGDGS